MEQAYKMFGGSDGAENWGPSHTVERDELEWDEWLKGQGFREVPNVSFGIEGGLEFQVYVRDYHRGTGPRYLVDVSIGHHTEQVFCQDIAALLEFLRLYAPLAQEAMVSIDRAGEELCLDQHDGTTSYCMFCQRESRMKGRDIRRPAQRSVAR